MNNIKDYCKKIFDEYKYIIFIVLVLSIIIFRNNLFFGETFAWYNDQAFQHNIFYEEWFRIIKETIDNRRLSFYSWNTFLGTDFFVSKLMYCVGDFLITPFFIFAAIVNVSFDYDFLFTITTIICFVLSAITMDIFLNNFGIKKQIIRNGFSLIYALSGFVIIYSGSYMFHRFYALLPLLFYYTNLYIDKRYKTGFAIVVFLLFMQSFELMFSTSIFLILYFILYYRFKYELNILKILKNSIGLIFAYFIGIMLCGFAIVPLAVYLQSNARVGAMDWGNLFWDFKTTVSFITAIICPAFNFRTDNPPYLFYTNQHFSSEFGIYATLLTVLGLVHLFKQGNQKEKKLFIASELIVLSFIFIRPLNMMVHGFSEPTLRWTFLYMFLNIIFAAYAFDTYDYKKTYKKNICIIIAAYAFILFIYILINNFDLKRYAPSIIVIFVSLLSLLLYDSLMVNKKIKHAFAIAFVTCVIFYAFMLTDMERYQNIDGAFNEEYLNYFENEDETNMFRYHFNSEDIKPFSALNLNASVKYDYRSVSTYDSTFDAMTSEFLRTNGYENWIIDINELDLMRMLGVKYIGLSDVENINNDNLKYAYNLDDLKIYELTNYNSIGHTYSLFKEDINSVENWNDELYVQKKNSHLVEDIIPQKKKQLNIVEHNRQYFKGVIETDGKEVLMVAIPFSEGWNVANQYGVRLNTFNVQGGFLGVVLEKGYHELSFYYGTPGLKQGLLVSLFGFVFMLYLIVSDAKIYNRKITMKNK